jgi:hypothetical protein
MRTYNAWRTDVRFRYPFEGCESIAETHSQAYQDIFVLSLLNGKSHGEYFEVGCNVPDYTNNTYLLAKNFDWNGTSIDFLSHLEPLWKSQRSNNKFVCCDALTVDYSSIIGESRNIDYLQLDIDPPENTLASLMRIPHDKYRFAVISFETDFYTGGNAPLVREMSRNFLSNQGYTLIVPDVIVDGSNPYEDWWVDLSLVNKEIALAVKEMANQTQNPFELLFKKT